MVKMKTSKLRVARWRRTGRHSNNPIGMPGSSPHETIQSRAGLRLSVASPLDSRCRPMQRIIETLIRAQRADFAHPGDPVVSHTDRDGKRRVADPEFRAFGAQAGATCKVISSAPLPASIRIRPNSSASIAIFLNETRSWASA